MLTRGREAHARASPDTVLSPLPRGFVRAVFLLLPVDTRLRCSEVNRAWRALLSDTTFFECLDLSVSSNLANFSLPLLRAALAKAGGRLRALDITDQNLGDVNNRLLLEVIVPCVAHVTELRAHTRDPWSVDTAFLLLQAAPALELFEAAVLSRNH